MNFSAVPSGVRPQRLVGDQLVGGEAVVQLDHVEVFGADAGRLVDLGRRGARHVVADDLAHVAAVEGARRVGGHGLRGDAHAGVEPVAAREVLGADDRRGGAAGRRAALQPGQRVEHHRRGEHLVERDRVAEHRERIARGVLARLHRDAGEGVAPDAVLLACSRARRRRRTARRAAPCRPSPAARSSRRRSAPPATAGRRTRPSARRAASARSRARARTRPRRSATAWRARNSALDPVAQLLLRLKTGMPVRPTPYTAAWPAVESP